MVQWRTSILLFTHSLVQLPRVATELKDSAVAVGQEHLRRVKTSEVENETKSVDIRYTTEHSKRKNEAADLETHHLLENEDVREEAEFLEDALMKRAGIFPSLFGSKSKDKKGGKGSSLADSPTSKTKPTFTGKHFDTLLEGKDGPKVEAGSMPTQLTSSPRLAFEKLFTEPLEDAPMDTNAVELDPTVGRLGLLSKHNDFIDLVCHHNVRIPKPIVRLKILVFDAWLMFTHGGEYEEKEQREKAGDANGEKAGDAKEDNFDRDIVQFKKVMYHYRPDIEKDVIVDSTNKEAKEYASGLEKAFDYHLKRCWEVAWNMNPRARDAAFGQTGSKFTDKEWKVMPWIRMHEFAYIFILAFGFAGDVVTGAESKNMNHWYNADWLDLMHWEEPYDGNTVATHAAPKQMGSGFTPTLRDRYHPHMETIKGTDGKATEERLYNFDLLDKWKQQLAGDRSAVTGQYVTLLHVTYERSPSGMLKDDDLVMKKDGYVKSVRAGSYSESAGVKAGMALVKFNDDPFDYRNWVSRHEGRMITEASYTLTFVTKDELSLYGMEPYNGDAEDPQYHTKDENTDDYVEFPFFIGEDNKPKQKATKTKAAPGETSDLFSHLESNMKRFDKQFPDTGFDDPGGLVDFREVDDQAWWWNIKNNRFSRKPYEKMKKDVLPEKPSSTFHTSPDAPKYYGPFEQITEERFLRHFMSQRLDMFNNFADASFLNHATLSEIQPENLEEPMEEMATELKIKKANTAALKAWVVKELRARSRLNGDAYRFAGARMGASDQRKHLMEHIRAQYLWRSERNENYERAQMKIATQLEELSDYRTFLSSVWRAAETMLPFVRLGHPAWINHATNFRGNFISDPAFHYAALVAQEFCWRHIREVKGTLYDKPYEQSFGRDILMLVPVEMPKNLISTYELKSNGFQADEEFESFAGQKVKVIRGAPVRNQNFNTTTYYRVPAQRLQDMPDPFIDPKTTFKHNEKDNYKGYGNQQKKEFNWNDVTKDILDELFGVNVWANFPVSDLMVPHTEPVSNVMTSYIDKMDAREIARLRAEEDKLNASAFDDDS